MKDKKAELIKDDMSERIVDVAAKIAQDEGADTVTVSRIIQFLGVSNRVFYNRFRNINEVLRVIYKRIVHKMHESVIATMSSDRDFFEGVIDMVGKSLELSYDAKMKFNNFFYEVDSETDSNYIWWTSEIKKLIDYAKAEGYIKGVDSEVLSYSVWCFCRGYNSDAVSRGLPKEEAVKNFKYSFSFFLDGLRK